MRVWRRKIKWGFKLNLVVHHRHQHDHAVLSLHTTTVSELFFLITPCPVLRKLEVSSVASDWSRVFLLLRLHFSCPSLHSFVLSSTGNKRSLVDLNRLSYIGRRLQDNEWQKSTVILWAVADVLYGPSVCTTRVQFKAACFDLPYANLVIYFLLSLAAFSCVINTFPVIWLLY